MQHHMLCGVVLTTVYCGFLLSVKKLHQTHLERNQILFNPETF